MYLISIGADSVVNISSECGCDPKTAYLKIQNGYLMYFDGVNYQKIMDLSKTSVTGFTNIENGIVPVPAGGILVIDKDYEFLALKPECNSCFQMHREDPFNGRTNSMVLDVAVVFNIPDTTLDTVTLQLIPLVTPDYATTVADWGSYTTAQGSSTKYQAWLDAITLALDSWQTDLPISTLTDTALPDNLAPASTVYINALADENGSYADVPIEFELLSTHIDGLKLKFYCEISGTFPSTATIAKVDVKLEGPLEGWFFGDLTINTFTSGVNQVTGSIGGKLHTTRLLKTEALGDFVIDGKKHFDSSKMYIINNGTESKNIEYLVCT